MGDELRLDAAHLDSWHFFAELVRWSVHLWLHLGQRIGGLLVRCNLCLFLCQIRPKLGKRLQNKEPMRDCYVLTLNSS